jgi:DNA-binding GntR family transcriptional regulator
VSNQDFRYRTKGELVEQHVRRRILSGELAPGSVINQVDLAAELSVSTTPLREALNHLRAEGLVYTDSSRDTRVTALSSDEAVHIYELRMNLDPLAATLAARRWEEHDAKQLRAIARQLHLALETSQDDDIIEVHHTFHRALYVASHNDILVGLLDVVWGRSDRYRRFGTALIPKRSVAERQAEHARLLDAVLARDEARAEAEMRQHVESSLTSMTVGVLGSGDCVTGHMRSDARGKERKKE